MDVVAVETARTSTEYAWDYVETGKDFPRESLAMRGGERQPIAVAEIAERLGGVLRRYAADVVAIPGWSSRVAFAARSWCARNGIPSVLMSESQAIDQPRNWFKEFVKRQYSRGFGAALVGGSRHIEYLVGLRIPEERIFLGYDAVDNEYFARGARDSRSNADRLRRQLSLPNRYFLASSRFIEKKNLPFLLRAFAAYHSQCSDSHPWDLVLLGDGPMRGEVEKLAGELRILHAVRLPGFKQYGELPCYYGLAGAFLHASSTEQWGLVVNEAMAAGLPVIVSQRCGCVPELVHDGANGFACDPFQTEDWARRMAELSSNTEILESFGKQSEKIVREWGPDRFARGLEHAANCARSLGVRRDRWPTRILLTIATPR
jgi:glycosyltransferase involved in cell wall biosynthesis